jgi:tetratricopeptide (TPR) repeat protein
VSSLDDLKEKLKAGKVIPFIGAGVSMSVEDKEGNPVFPSWKGLLERAVQALRDSDKEHFANLVEDQINKNIYLDAAKYARDGLKGDWNDFLDKQFNPKLSDIPDSSFEIAKLIWQLGSQLVITTNYDKVLRRNKANIDIWDIEAKYRQGKALVDGLPENPTVWHLHGYIDNPSDIILTPDGYQKLYPDNTNAKVKYETSLTTLKSLLIPYTFLFIGFSLEDTNFTDQIKQINDLFDGSTGNHFALVKETDKNRIDSLGLPVKPITYNDHGQPLIDLLRELVGEVDQTETPDEPYIPPIHTADYSPEKRAFYVPFRPKGKDVIGRENDLERVRESLLSGKATRIGQAVSFEGMGGLGKTQLAVEYAYQYEKEYKNGVIWITADQDIDKQLIDLAERSQWIAPESEPKDKLAVAQHRLKTITDCLIIFDNVELFSEIESYLPESTEKVHLLATSRFDLDVFVPIPINLLTPEQSIEMLERESGRTILQNDEREIVKKIAESLGRLPLALELAGAYLLKRGDDFSWQKYWDLLEKNPKSAFINKDLKGSFTHHDADVYRTLKISETLLAEENHLKEILDLLTWSGTSSMGLSLMCKLLGVGDEANLTGALALGGKLRFLQKSPNREAYAIHRLVAQVRQEDIPLGDRKEWVEVVSLRLGEWFQEKREDFAKLSDYESEIEHLTAWQKHAREQSPNQASRLLWLQAYPPYHRGKYKESYALIEEAKQVYDVINCEDPAVLAHLMNDLGATAKLLGDFTAALDFHRKAFNLRFELFGEKHPDTAVSYGNLGNTYGNLGKYEEQLEFLKKALDIQLELFGEKHPHTAISYGNLGLAYRNLGRHQEQLEFVQKALDIGLEVFGEKHPFTATSYNNLGGAYGRLHKFEEQLELGKRSLAIRLELFGEKHPDTAISYNNLGTAYEIAGKYDLAIETGYKAVVLCKELLGKSHPNTIFSVHSLIDHLVNNPRRDKFIEMKTKALSVVNEFLQSISTRDPEHKKLVRTREWIEDSFQKKGLHNTKKKTRHTKHR